MGIDINGYALANVSGLKFGTSNTKVIAANYGISQPTLPGMMGAATAGGAFKAYPFVVNDVNLNIGSCWSTSTYRFTAPVTGIYYTSYGGIVGTGAQDGYFSIIVNGGLWHYGYRNSNASWELFHMELLLNLAAGDWFSWAMNLTPGAASAGAGGAYTSGHNAVTVWFVG